MIKKSVCLLYICLFLAAMPCGAAEDYEVKGKWHFGSTFSWYDPDGYTWNNQIAGTSKHPFDGLMDDAFYGKGLVGYTWRNGWRLEASAGKWASEGSRAAMSDGNIQNSFAYMVQDSDGNGQPYDGLAATSAFIEASVKPVEIDLSFVFPFRHRKFKPYAGLGFARYKTESNMIWQDFSSSSILGLRCIQSVSSTNLHAGFDYFVNRDFAIRLDGRYVICDNELSIQPEDVSYNVNTVGAVLSAADVSNIVLRYNALKDNVDIEGFQFGLGFTFYFR